MQIMEKSMAMKRVANLLVVSVFVMAALLIFVAVAYAYVELTIIQAADCDNYWQGYSLSADVPVCSESGTGRWAWGDKTEATLPVLHVVWQTTCTSSYLGGGGTIRKSDWCSASGGPGPKSGGLSASTKPVALPSKQWYLTYDADDIWCGIFVRSPIVDVARVQVCFPGNPPSTINDFCMQPVYADLKGCQTGSLPTVNLWEMIR